jgi:hypothetical protein
LEVSQLVKDWKTSSMQTESQVEGRAKTYIKFSRLWLMKRGYWPIEIRLVNGYNQKSAGYGYNPDPQAKLRSQIMADFISPANWGLPMSQWKGITTPNIRPIPPDNGSKG